MTYRDRTRKVRAEGFRTSLVQDSKPADAAKILHEAGAELTEGFSSRLSWTHYRALLAVSDPAARAFYEIEAERENWSTPHLKRQIFTSLHLRLLKSRNKAGVMELARKGQTVERPSDLIKSPLILDFLGLADHHAYRESDLETAILSKLPQSLLELGKGFAFVARQKRLTFDDDQLFIDLVFYNVLLKCYLLIDLKLGRLTHQDAGQMDSYVRMFDAHERTPGDGPTIGLILCAEENHTIARYSVLNEHKQLFAAKYLTHLPTEEELRRELDRNQRLAEASVEAPHAEEPTKPERATRAKGGQAAFCPPCPPEGQMTTALSPVIASRLEKAAVGNGYDQELPRENDWLGFASTQCPLRIWLGTFGDAVFLATFSQQNVPRALGEYGTPIAAPLPKGALGGRTVTDIPSLHRLLRRAFQLSKTLPDELLHSFEKQTAALPKTTEAERVVVQRVGQDLFRHGLLEYWEGRCAITGLAVPELLRASHIKPWADCSSDAERLDIWNGLLLAPHLDAAFDRGFITVADDGAVIVSVTLDAEALAILGLDRPIHVCGLADGHRGYLPWHRERVFQAGRVSRMAQDQRRNVE